MAQYLSDKGTCRFDYAATIKFWEDPANYNKIIRAVPLMAPVVEETQTSDENGDTRPKEQLSVATTLSSDIVVERVSSQDLAAHPYSSVGKVFWLNDSSAELKWCTAFYIGGGEIMTVSHAFFNSGNISGIVFVPAMDGNSDIFGKKFGYYPVEFATLHSSYDKSDHVLTRVAYDVATCQLGEGKKLKPAVYATGKGFLGSLQGLSGEDLESKFETVGSVLFKPIAPVSFRQHPPGKPTVWTIVGYGCHSADEGSEGEMCKVSGSKVPYYNMRPGQSLDSNKILAMNLLTLSGMVGSPWLVGFGRDLESHANGCQALSDQVGKMSLTPRFTSTLLREFGLM